MAPMTRSFSPGGVPSADVAAYYRRRAEAALLDYHRRHNIDHDAASGDPKIPEFPYA